MHTSEDVSFNLTAVLQLAKEATPATQSNVWLSFKASRSYITYLQALCLVAVSPTSNSMDGGSSYRFLQVVAYQNFTFLQLIAITGAVVITVNILEPVKCWLTDKEVGCQNKSGPVCFTSFGKKSIKSSPRRIRPEARSSMLESL